MYYKKFHVKHCSRVQPWKTVVDLGWYLLSDYAALASYQATWIAIMLSSRCDIAFLLRSKSPNSVRYVAFLLKIKH